MAHPYGQIRIMSSFDFVDPDQGPPADEDGNLIPPTINPVRKLNFGFNRFQ
jgi:alpha-amylase